MKTYLAGVAALLLGAAVVGTVTAPTASAATSPRKCAQMYAAYHNAPTERAEAKALIRGVTSGCFVQVEPQAWAWALDVLDPDHQ
jgi:dihydrodipicolinate synthase/N-acetylneuraminate lyase